MRERRRGAGSGRRLLAPAADTGGSEIFLEAGIGRSRPWTELVEFELVEVAAGGKSRCVRTVE